MPEQLKINTVRKLVINENRIGRPPSNQSMNEEIKFRVSDDAMKKVIAFCAGRGITRSDYGRTLLELDPQFLDHIKKMNSNIDVLIPMLERLSKNF